jgi:polar amino acid transport system substrate-binding protein
MPTPAQPDLYKLSAAQDLIHDLPWQARQAARIYTERPPMSQAGKGNFGMRSLMRIAATVALFAATTLAAEAQSSASAGQFQSAADLHGKRLAVAVGSAQEAWLTKNYPDSIILQYDTIPDLVVAVTSGKADATLKDEGTLKDLLRRNETVSVLGESMFKSPLASGFRKGHPETRLQFNHFLKKIRANGVYDEMVDRWMKRGEDTMPKITESGRNGTLTVGVSLIGLPLATIKDNVPTGLFFEIIERFAADIGKTPKIQLLEVSGMVAATAAGKVDMITALYDTEERRKMIDFSDPIYEMGNMFVVLKKNMMNSAQRSSDGKIRSAADLHGRRIAVLLGSAYESYATKNYPDSTILQYQNASDVLAAVKYEKADASVNDTDSLREILKTETEMAAVGDSLFSFTVGAGFRKSDTALRMKFNAFLADLRKSGEYDRVINPWMLGERTQLPPIAETSSNGVLNIGTANIGLPWVAYQDNQLVGADIELMTRFAASLGKKANFTVMDFGALIAALSSGKVDMIASDIFITEERKKAIDFSDPYYEAGNKIYALKKNIGNAGGDSADAKTDAEVPTSTFLSRLKDSFESNIIAEKRYLMIWDGLKTTMLISILATIFGTALGGVICFMRMSPKKLLNVPAKVYISILRGTPVLVLLMLIFYVVFGSVNISPTLVAVIAFGMNFAAYFSEIFRSGMMSIDNGQREAGIAMGLTSVQTFIHVLLPQTIVRILPVYKGEFISLVKMTSIVGYIAVHDLTKAGDIIRSRTFDAFFPLVMIAIFYFLIAALLIQGLEYLERRTDPVARRRQGDAQ